MPVTLNINQISNPDKRTEQTFTQERITIGRDSSNILHIDDPQRSISRRHAELRREGDNYLLFDAGSRNGTFLNDKKVGADNGLTVQNGDIIKIGDYHLRFQFVPEVNLGEETVVLDLPFKKETEDIAELLTLLKIKYETEGSRNKSGLKQAMKSAFGESDLGEVGTIMAEALGAEAQPNVDRKKPKAEFDIGSETSVMARIGKIWQEVFESVIIMVKGAWKFRTEFIGQTVFQANDSLHSMSPKELQSFLLDPAISEKEAGERLDRVKAQIDEAMLHQIALLDGYRVSVKEGMQQLLQHINPAQVEAELSKQFIKIGPFKIPSRVIPFYVEQQAYQIFKKRLSELSKEDRGTFDRKIFRPSFIHAYMKTMSNARKEITETKD